MVEPGRLQLQPTGKNNSTAPISTFIIHTSSISNIRGDALDCNNADQSTTENYKASELLIGRDNRCGSTENAVKIEAKHVLSQMIINLVAGKRDSTEAVNLLQPRLVKSTA